MISMMNFLDRENCIREFTKKPWIFPPSSTALSYASLNGNIMEKCLKTPFIYSFDGRLKLFTAEMASKKSIHTSYSANIMKIRRGYEFQDSIPHIPLLRSGSISVQYVDEIGVGHGVYKEYICKAVEQV